MTARDRQGKLCMQCQVSPAVRDYCAACGLMLRKMGMRGIERENKPIADWWVERK